MGGVLSGIWWHVTRRANHWIGFCDDRLRTLEALIDPQLSVFNHPRYHELNERRFAFHEAMAGMSVTGWVILFIAAPSRIVIGAA